MPPTLFVLILLLFTLKIVGFLFIFSVSDDSVSLALNPYGVKLTWVNGNSGSFFYIIGESTRFY
jgi:hypothetical protein